MIPASEKDGQERGSTSLDSLADDQQVNRDAVDRLYDRARALEPKARRAFVASACQEAPKLGDEVLSLLQQADAAEEFFQRLSQAVTAPAPRISIPDLAIGQTVGHYQILERIGAGGMGTVYRAQDTRLNRQVALKFLPPHLTARPEAQERLLVEARAAAALEHPNVCTVLASLEAPGRLPVRGARPIISQEEWYAPELYVALGDTSRAVSMVLAAFAEHPHRFAYMRCQTVYPELAREPRIQEIIRRIGFPE